MKIPYLLYSLLALIALLLGMTFLRSFSFPDSSFPLQKGERVVVMPGEVLTQPLVSSREGLRKIEVLFGKFTLTGDAKLLLELRDESCTSVLAQKTLSGRSFDSEYTHAFIFDRIQDSQGKTYCFTVSFISNQPIKKDKAPRFFIDKESPASPYSLTNPGGEKTLGAGSIALRPGFTNDSFFANAKEFFDRISQYKPVFLKSWFLIGFATLGLVLTFSAIAFLIREEKE